MKLQIFVLFAGILLFLPCRSSAQAGLPAPVEQNIESRIAEGDFVGISLAFIDSNGTIFFLNKGMIEIDSEIPVDEHTLYEIGSITKTFTTSVLALLVSSGELSLNEAADILLPDSVRLSSFDGRKITFRHLATHTSGLPRLPADLMPENPDNPYADYTIGDMYAFLMDYELPRAPDESFEYSNLAMGLLGHLLERKTGMEYERMVRHYLTGPLGMESTVVAVPGTAAGRFARGHAGGAVVENWDIPALAGAGALRSTSTDMTTWVKAHMGLSSAGLYEALAKTHEMQLDSIPGSPGGLGLGWFISTRYDTIVWHGGGTGGYRSFAGFNKQSGTGAVVLGNTTSEVTDIGLHLLDSRHELTVPVKSVEVDPEILATYHGTYESELGISFFVIHREGELWVRLSGQQEVQVYSKNDTRFFYKVVPAEITFRVSEGGVEGLTLYQGGREIYASKQSEDIVETQRKEIEIDPDIFDRYTGEYQIMSGFSITITREGDRLYTQATAQPKFPVFPESKTRFFLKVVDAQIEFVRGEDGSYDTLKLYQTGQVLTGKRRE